MAKYTVSVTENLENIIATYNNVSKIVPSTFKFIRRDHVYVFVYGNTNRDRRNVSVWLVRKDGTCLRLSKELRRSALNCEGTGFVFDFEHKR